MIGSGAWACAAMHVVAQNLEASGDVADEFCSQALMYVYEEDWQVCVRLGRQAGLRDGFPGLIAPDSCRATCRLLACQSAEQVYVQTTIGVGAALVRCSSVLPAGALAVKEGARSLQGLQHWRLVLCYGKSCPQLRIVCIWSIMSAVLVCPPKAY